MSANVVALAELQASNGTKDPIAAAELLGAMLNLPDHGWRITGAKRIGPGAKASCTIYLAKGTDRIELEFESLLRDFTPKTIAAELALAAGVEVSLKQPQITTALTHLHAIAEHQESLTAQDLAFDWGATYLQSAQTLEVDVNDAQQRWGAFCRLNETDPVSVAARDATSIAAASIVLCHLDGTRYVRCGWFQSYVRKITASVGPEQVAQRMQSAGWQRRGKTGRIKATRPELTGSLVWTFYLVPADWESSR